MATNNAISPSHLLEDPLLTNGFHEEDELESEEGHHVSEEEYWENYYSHPDFSYEWNNGKLEVRPVSDYAQFRVYLWFLGLLKDYLHVYPIARMIGLEMGFRLKLPRKTTIRKPDLAVVLDSNPVPLGDKDRSYQGIFDICIESLSDSSKREVERDTKTKKLEYAQAGVREYFILDDNRQNTVFYRLNERGIYVPIQPQDGVIHSTVLPNFRLREADLYALPEPPQMIGDPVYQHFTSPFLRAERERADEAQKRADEAQKRAEEAQKRENEAQKRADEAMKQAELSAIKASLADQRANRYAEKLAQLGISIDD